MIIFFILKDERGSERFMEFSEREEEVVASSSCGGADDVFYYCDSHVRISSGTSHIYHILRD